MKAEFQFRLYICGQTGRSQRAAATVKRLCEEKLAGGAELEVIDVLTAPARADEDKVLATPTLIKVAPKPVRRVVGDFSDPSRLHEVLDLPV
jgi:circadian clock protein KaiB